MGPVRHQIRVRDEHPGSVCVGAEHVDWLAGLHEQGLVLVQPLQGGHDEVEITPRPRRAADDAIDHQLVGVFRHLQVEVVHQHPHGRLGQPGLRGDVGAEGRVDNAEIAARGVHLIVVAFCVSGSPRW